MSAPVAISAGNYVGSASTTIADITTETVAANSTLIAIIFWYGAGSLTSVTGGDLEWSVQVTSGGTAHRIAIVTAQAPDGLIVGTSVTATLSGFQDARGIRLVAYDALTSSGGVDSQPSTNTSDWAGTVTTSATGILVGAAWYDYNPGNLVPMIGSAEVYQWRTVDGSVSHLVYANTVGASSYTVGGSGGTNGRTSATLALQSVSSSVAEGQFVLWDGTSEVPVTPVLWDGTDEVVLSNELT